MSHGTERNDQTETSIICLKETKCSEYLKIFETSTKAPSVCKRVNNQGIDELSPLFFQQLIYIDKLLKWLFILTNMAFISQNSSQLMWLCCQNGVFFKANLFFS